MTKAPRPLPLLNADNEAYWTGGAQNELLIYRCQNKACGYYVHPPTPFCPKCEGRDVKPEAVSGRATVISYTVNHKVWLPDLEVPYVLALVALEEQPDVQLPTNIVGCPPGEVKIGMKVSVLFEQNEEIFVPLFTPVRE